MRNKLLLPGYRKHSVPITYSFSFFLLIFSYGHGLLLAWEDDPKIDGLGEVKEVPKSLSVECVHTGVYTGVNVCKVEWSCWKD